MRETKHKTQVTQQRINHVMAAVDHLAKLDLLAQVTSRLVVQYSGVSEGVIFRHFKNMNHILSIWIEMRGKQLLLFSCEGPAGRNGLLYLMRELMSDQTLLNFLCCHPMANPDLREQLLIYRYKIKACLQRKVTHTTLRPQHIPVEMLTDHLWLSLCDVWRGALNMKELLMSQLPWEKNQKDQLPDLEVIQRLALNQSGFVFDPVNGASFTANETGLKILQCLQQNQSVEAMIPALAIEFDASETEIERDMIEFVAQLRRIIK